MPMKCKVVIEGVGVGILTNNPARMAIQESTKTARKREYVPEVEADLSAYWNPEHTEVGFPGRNIRRGLVEACSGLKVPGQRKLALAPIVAGDVWVVEPWIGFGTKDYLVDSQRGIIQRQGVMRHRAHLPKWSLSFTVEWETSMLGKDFHKTVLVELLTILGERIGIGDYRLQKKGPYGKFRIVSIELIKESA